MKYEMNMNLSNAELLSMMLTEKFSLELKKVQTKEKDTKNRVGKVSSYTYEVNYQGSNNYSPKVYLTFQVCRYDKITVCIRKMGWNNKPLYQLKEDIPSDILYGLDGELLPHINNFQSRNLEVLRFLCFKHGLSLFAYKWGYTLSKAT